MIKKIKSKSININKKGQIINKNLKNELNSILMIIKIDIDKNLKKKINTKIKQYDSK
jgi:hypothetical protein